ncbi:unnamed protein product [Mytilus edulis]|uniref:Uncharacterized protein n=1 Tax=Mytilus edulis TaxID=6550 RepID=A0A8S3UZ65_MYTED|nr:unnamed protein product [Mytilus edulis]
MTLADTEKTISQIKDPPNVLVLHSLTNDLKESAPVCVSHMKNLMSHIHESMPSTTVVVSLATPRADNKKYQTNVELVNAMLKCEYMEDDTVTLCDNGNLSRLGKPVPKFLARDQYHLSKDGIAVLASNLRWTIDSKSSGKKRSFPYRKVRYGKIVVNGLPLDVLPLTPMSDYGEKKNQNDFTNKGNLGRNASTIRHFNFYIHPASPSMDALPHVVARVRLLIADTDLLRQFHLIYRAQQLDCKKIEELAELIKPIAEQLYEQYIDLPFTVIYVENLGSPVYYFHYLEYQRKENGYNGENIPEHKTISL